MSSTTLQERIGYRFHNEGLLERALTHSSYANETGERNHHLCCNERLEFLGDAVLQLLSGRYLYERFPMLPEGELSQKRSELVCEDALALFAREIGLGGYLLFGRGEAQSGGAEKSAILADAFEALVAAIYLDAQENGLRAASDFVLPFLEKKLEQMPENELDCKTHLQMFLQRDGNVRPVYKVVGQDGPDHAKIFSVEAYLDSNCIGRGTGTSIRRAEQAAAEDALRLFGVVN
ncbi:MAG: ribonuclease III [Ruminococcaceae bacterium]|nr:ribonuclease III [Oscillospiraceae bacterium]